MTGPYLEILLALAKLPDLVVPFDNILSVVPERRRPGIKAVRPRIKEVLFDVSKGIDLRKQIAFEDTSFSIEDPLFRYFLNNIDIDGLHTELGIKKSVDEDLSLYTYDIGFSFAGEARGIVEEVNKQLKLEDVITFYDYDSQAFLLAENLETVLGRIYAESCRYYLVFIDEYYKEKVWTNYERDVLTSTNRARHIIPVYLIRHSTTSVVGIPSVTGMIDLSDIWRQFKEGKMERSDLIVTIRNRLVLPILEKLDTAFHDI